MNEEKVTFIEGKYKDRLMDQKSYKEPESLIDKKETSINPLSLCMSESFAVNFDEEELSLFRKLAKVCDKAFDSEKPHHTKTLCRLYEKVFECETDVKTALNNDAWKEIGFQNSMPSTDFRGGGYLSLKALVYFCRKEKELLQDIISFSNKHENFLFACVVISIVFFLKRFLHFGVFSNYQKHLDAKKLSSRSVVKYFLTLSQKNEQNDIFVVFFDLVVFLNKKIYFLWKMAFLDNPKLRIIDFKQVEDIVKDNFIIAIEKVSKLGQWENENSLDRFFKVFDQLPIPSKIAPYEFN